MHLKNQGMAQSHYRGVTNAVLHHPHVQAHREGGEGGSVRAPKLVLRKGPHEAFL